MNEVQQALADLGIPDDATLIVERQVVEAKSLTDKFRPLTAGPRIRWAGAGDSYCTLGFMAYRAGESDPKFVVNSHCTAAMWDVDGRIFGQPNDDSADRIGYEIVDPDPWSGGVCTPGRVCRYSDAALGALEVSGSLGLISRPVERVPLAGSRTVDSGNPTIRIDGKQAYSYEGETLDKVGVRTGWTYGTVDETCETYYTGIYERRCQDRVVGGGDGGDSGSPVFYYHAGSGTATLVGILWGVPVAGGWYFIFSPLVGIEADMGQLDVTWRPPLYVNISGEFSPQVYQRCRYVANPGGGSGLYLYEWYENGVLRGSGSSHYVNLSSHDVDLKVVVEDSWGGSAYKIRTIDVDYYGALCK